MLLGGTGENYAPRIFLNEHRCGSRFKANIAVSCMGGKAYPVKCVP